MFADIVGYTSLMKIDEPAAVGYDKYALKLVLKAVEIYDPYLPYKGIKLKADDTFRQIEGFDAVMTN